MHTLFKNKKNIYVIAAAVSFFSTSITANICFSLKSPYNPQLDGQITVEKNNIIKILQLNKPQAEGIDALRKPQYSLTFNNILDKDGNKLPSFTVDLPHLGKAQTVGTNLWTLLIKIDTQNGSKNAQDTLIQYIIDELYAQRERTKQYLENIANAPTTESQGSHQGSGKLEPSISYASDTPRTEDHYRHMDSSRSNNSPAHPSAYTRTRREGDTSHFETYVQGYYPTSPTTLSDKIDTAQNIVNGMNALNHMDFVSAAQLIADDFTHNQRCPDEGTF